MADIKTNFKIDREVSLDKYEDWKLCFQYGEYIHSDRDPEPGYRFIWREPNGNQRAARGQARIPSIADMLELLAKAVRDGWDLH